MSTAPPPGKPLNTRQTPEDNAFDPRPPESLLLGWPAMFKAVRESDVAKVSDCKDDIDTLLVFAGLYSAVLTAFIVESYQNLQQDKQDVMIDLMQRMLLKSYALNSGFLNSTVPAVPPLPPFEPPQWAIRVNVLWFLSLIISLSAASLGMLVKQWLREYLALDYLSARERLRAREYRNPPLLEWGVFDIAAALPLMLQISLSLFFLGLCFFTAAMHSSIGYTTIPVVAAWAFLFLLTTVAPLFSPRCPYKMTFLKTTMRIGRRLIAPFVRPLLHSCFWYGSLAVSSLRRTIFKAHDTPDAQVQDHDDPMDWGKVLQEEEEVVRSDQDDVDILLSVDRIKADEGLLPTMLAVLGEPKDSANLVRLVVCIINSRLGLVLPAHTITIIPDLRALSKQTWVYLTDAVAHAFANIARNGVLPPICPGWALDAIILLLSHSDYELSYQASRTLQMFFKRDTRNHLSAELANRLRQAGAQHQVRLAPQLIRNLFRSGGDFLCVTCLLELFSIRLHQDTQPRKYPTLMLLRAQRADPTFWRDPARVCILDDMLECLSQFLHWALPLRIIAVSGISPLLHVAMELCRGMERHDALVAICKLCWPLGPWSHIFTSTFGGGQSRFRASALEDDGPEILAQAFEASTAEDRRQILINTREWFQFYTDGKWINPKMYHPADVVRVCFVYLRVQHRVKAFTSEGEDDAQAVGVDPKDWVDTWKACAQALGKYHKVKGWVHPSCAPGLTSWIGAIRLVKAEPAGEILQEDRVMAAKCLELLYSWGLGQTSSSPTQAATVREQIFPTVLVDALRLFTLPVGDGKATDPEHSYPASSSSSAPTQDADTPSNADALQSLVPAELPESSTAVWPAVPTLRRIPKVNERGDALASATVTP